MLILEPIQMLHLQLISENRTTLRYRVGKVGTDSDRFASLFFEEIMYTAPQEVIFSEPIICGNVSDNLGNPLVGVTVEMTGDQVGSTTTDVNGDYTFTITRTLGVAAPAVTTNCDNYRN